MSKKQRNESNEPAGETSELWDLIDENLQDAEEQSGEEYGDFAHSEDHEPHEEGDENIEADADAKSDYADFEDLQNAAEELLEPDEGVDTSRRSQRNRKSSRAKVRSYGTPPLGLFVVGTLVLMAGVGLYATAAVQPDGALLAYVARLGITPGPLLIIGIALMFMARTAHEHRKAQFRLKWLEQTMAENEEFNAECLDFLVDAQEQSLTRQPASGEELENVLHTLTRQDEKIANLTRALKMYGKPLVEVNRHVGEVGLKMRTISTQIDKLTDGQSDNGNEEVLAALDEIGGRIINDISKIIENSPADTGNAEALHALRSQLDSLSAAMTNLNGGGAVAAPAPAPAATSSRKSKSKSKSKSKAEAPTGPGNLAQSISGSKASSAAGVRGAIAKLKKMRP